MTADSFVFFNPRLLFALLFMLFGIAGAQEESFEPQIETAEKPLVDFRKNYLTALERHKEKLQQEGKVEHLSLIEERIKEFKEGGWPGDSRVWTGSGLEAKFIISYWRIYPQVEQSLRAIAAKAQSPAVNERVKERLAYWTKNPIGPHNPGSHPLTYAWEVSQNPLLSDKIGSAKQPKPPLREVLIEHGIHFNNEAGAVFTGENKVIATNLPWELVKIDRLFRDAGIVK